MNEENIQSSSAASSEALPPVAEANSSAASSASSNSSPSSLEVVGLDAVSSIALPVESAAETVADARPIMTTSLNDYTVSEGYLFIITIVLCFTAIISIFRGRY